MAKEDPPHPGYQTGTMAPWEGFDIGFSPANAAGAVGGAFTRTVDWPSNASSAPTNLSPYGGANSASTWVQNNTSSGGGTSTRPAAAPAAAAPVAPAKASTQHTSWGPPTMSAGASGMMQAAASPGSIIQRSIQTALANRAPRRTGQTGTGLQSAAGAGIRRRPASSGSLFAGGPSISNSAAVAGQRSTGGAPSISINAQRTANIAARAQTPAQKAADPLNWAGIAKDLGNAGDARFSKYATGDIASTTARRLVGNQQAAATSEVRRARSRTQASKATKAASKTSKRGGKNSNRAV